MTELPVKRLRFTWTSTVWPAWWLWMRTLCLATLPCERPSPEPVPNVFPWCTPLPPCQRPTVLLDIGGITTEHHSSRSVYPHADASAPKLCTGADGDTAGPWRNHLHVQLVPLSKSRAPRTVTRGQDEHKLDCSKGQILRLTSNIFTPQRLPDKA